MADRARAWLEEFRRQSGRHPVLALPYGDLDVASVLTGPVRALYARAVALTRSALADHGVRDATPVVDPVGGYLPPAVPAQLGPGTTTILSAAAAPAADRPVATVGRSRAVLTDPQASAGGPDPSTRYSALAVRQRLVSEAALHALSPERHRPLVVTMPDDWDPGSTWRQAQLATGLDQPWLQLVDLGPVLAGAPTGGTAVTLTYPRSQSAAEVPVLNQLAARRLVRTGGVFARLLTNNDTVDDHLARVAVLAASSQARTDPGAAAARTDAVTDYVRSQLARVHVDGPPFVMMSGESGPIQVTLVNDLQQTVTAGLSVSTPGSHLRIASYPLVTLGPGRRTSIHLEASSDDIGVHSVTLQVVDADGVPLESTAQFNVRTSHVSTVIWVIMAVGAGLLFLTIGVRLYRRLRRRRATHGPLLPRAGTSADRRPVAGRRG